MKLKLLIRALRRRLRERRCEHDWIIPAFDLNQREYRVFCPICGKELWWGGDDGN